MSWFSGSNNIHQNMPPMMSDGRNFTNLQPESVTNNNIQQKAGIKNNWEYRNYLQNNANDIMKYNFMDYSNSSGNNPNTYVNNQMLSNSPFVFKSTYDQNKPTYGYNNSDLKHNYLTREQLNSRMIAPSISTNFNS